MNRRLALKQARPLLAAGIALAGFQGVACADMRCGTALVAEGASTYDVRTKCGPPAQRDVIPAAPGAGAAGRNHAATLEHWVYGPRNGATYQLKFIDGTLVRIDSSR
jgi:hypothetical protein